MKEKLWVATLVLTQLVGWPMRRVVAADVPPAEQRYWAGYRVGRNDVRQHCHHQWNDPFISAGYQRGMKEEQEVVNNSQSSFGDQPSPEVNNTVPPAGDQEENRNQSAVTLPLSIAQRQFINRLAPQAQRMGQQYDLFPSVLLAQAALESNWGQSGLAAAHHNLFGIKALPGQAAVPMTTCEDTSGGMVQTVANFCHYRTEEESLSAYAKLLQSPAYRGVHRQQAHNYQMATRALTCLFATDRSYDQKLNRLISDYHLDRYDQYEAVKVNTETSFRHVRKVPAKRAAEPVHHQHDSRVAPTRKLAWYWWPVSIISGGSFTWLVDFWCHRP